MTIKFLSKVLSVILLGGALAISSGCGGKGGNNAASSVDQAKASALEAKANTGDGDAAFKLGELYAADTGSRESAIRAAFWFTVAGGLGNNDAKAALDAISSGMPGEDKLEVQRRVSAYKPPTPKK